jgi:Mn2+/Fe2+ NRAMP family transporter
MFFDTYRILTDAGFYAFTVVLLAMQGSMILRHHLFIGSYLICTAFTNMCRLFLYMHGHEGHGIKPNKYKPQIIMTLVDLIVVTDIVGLLMAPAVLYRTFEVHPNNDGIETFEALAILLATYSSFLMVAESIEFMCSSKKVQECPLPSYSKEEIVV